MDLTAYDDPQDAVGVAFRLTRRRLKLSQRELADALGWDAAKVGRWECGQVAPALARVDGVLRGMGFRLAVVASYPQEWTDVEEPHEHAVDRAFRRLPAHLDQEVREVRPVKWWLRNRHKADAMAPVWTYRRRSWWDEFAEQLAQERAAAADGAASGAGAAAAADADAGDDSADMGDDAPGKV
jgi:transcriptional regulator with XRE-family HTH domain